MTDSELDNVRMGILDRMERDERLVRHSIIGAALLEALLFVAAFRLLDFGDPLHKILFIFFTLSYTIVVLGLIALGAHVSRTVGRVLVAVEAAAASPGGR